MKNSPWFPIVQQKTNHTYGGRNQLELDDCTSS